MKRNVLDKLKKGTKELQSDLLRMMESICDNQD